MQGVGAGQEREARTIEMGQHTGGETARPKEALTPGQPKRKKRTKGVAKGVAGVAPATTRYRATPALWRDFPLPRALRGDKGATKQCCSILAGEGAMPQTIAAVASTLLEMEVLVVGVERVAIICRGPTSSA